MATAPQDYERLARTAVAAHRGERGPLLPVLHDIVEELGWVPPQVVAVLADELNLSRADVHGVITFYPDFRTSPPGAVVAQVCRAEACQAVGGPALLDAAQTRYGDDPDVTVEEVFCLGNCALGPAALVDGRLHGRLTPQTLSQLIEVAR